MKSIVAVCLCAGSIMLAWPGAVAVTAVAPCDLTKLHLIGGEPRDVQDACEGARNAVSFFLLHGFHASEPMELEITDQLPEEFGASAAGLYLEQRKRMLILSYDRFKKNGTWFKVPIDRRLYRSLATHEMAHALASLNFSIPRPTIQAKEYLAYVTMFAGMEPALRADILKMIPGSGFSGEEKITPIFSMFDPMRFGVECYRHYLKQENGPRFLADVLAGRALID